MPRTIVPAVAVVLICGWLDHRTAAVHADEAQTAKRVEFFETRIRPVLAEHCYACHNSTETTEGELALDHRDGLLAGGASGAAVVPGKPDKSRLLAVIRHEIAGQEMPDDGPKLDEPTIADFEQWIADGAVDPRDEPPTAEELASANDWAAQFERRRKWWSFQPIRPVAVPAVRRPDWSDHPVDRFVLEGLEANDLAPAPLADAHTLVRRLYFVLIGLPPTPEELTTWSDRIAVDDDRAEGVGQLADHLLASPHFGERWARHWMDWIRYAESHGSEGDPPIEGAWRYRDYLIRALNADVPYDQLVREHVAGDLLAEPRVNRELAINESVIGTAHWRMVFHGFAPTDALDEKVRFVDDQVNVFSKAFLGLTVSCARCHDHKFDAISQRDYYALFGILASCRPGRTTIDLPERLEQNRAALAELKPKLREALADDWASAATRMAESLLAADVGKEQSEKPDTVRSVWAAMQRAVAADGMFDQAWQQRVTNWQEDLARRREHDERTYLKRWRMTDANDYAAWTRHGAGLPDEPLSAGAFAVAPDGDSAVSGVYPAGIVSHRSSTKDAARLTSPDVHLDAECDLWLRVIGGGKATARYVVQDYPRNGTVYPVADLADRWRWQRFDLAYWTGDDVHLELAAARDAPLLVKNEARSWLGIREAVLVRKGSPGPPADTQEHLDALFAACGASDSRDDPRDADRPGHGPRSLADLAAAYAQATKLAIAAWHDGRASDTQAAWLDGCLREELLPNRLGALPAAKPLVERYRALEAAIAEPVRVPGLEETTGRVQKLFVRGNHKNPAEEVPRRFLEAINATQYGSDSSGRLQLAESLLAADNPLVRRVIVNRVWHHLFGHGLVRSPDNFGRMGQMPTHPELLDHLAIRFAGASPATSDDVPPPSDNFDWSLKRLIRYLVTSKTWQQASTPSPTADRVDPENRLLSHANVRRMEGEAVRDALLQVSGQLDTARFGPPVDGKSPRRSIYVQVRRNALDPFLRVFDFPEPFSTTGRRDVTNVPAQSLTMMDDALVDRLAERWAERVQRDATLPNDTARIDRMFRAAFGRPADQGELATLVEYLAEAERRSDHLAKQSAQLNDDITSHRDAERAILDPVRARLLAEAKAGRATPHGNLPQPIALWKFDDDYRDSIGDAHGTPHGGAMLRDGALVVDGRAANVVTALLETALGEKTLAAWVQLDNLDQRGGGVISVQTPDGVTFDAIVFGEKDPQQWLAGSNIFARTQSFGGMTEQDAVTRPVHVAIAYHADGRIVGYRDGQPYGAAYESNGPVAFQEQQTVVGFGVRHLPAVGNRVLAGRILQAQLYDRALTDEEVQATSRALGTFVAEADVLAALSWAERQRVEQHRAAVVAAEARVPELGPLPSGTAAQAAWKDLARALFCFKEFIYVR